MTIDPRLAALLLCAAIPARADVYKWADESGVVHYSNVLPAGIKVKKVHAEAVSAYRPVAPSAGAADAPAAAPSAPDIQMYGTSWNPGCQAARKALWDRGILFTEYDIEKDPAAFARAQRLGFTGAVPLMVVNGRSRTGFSQEWLDQQLQR